MDYSKIDITSLLSFLTAMYNEGCSYSYINTARSALSVIFGITEEAKLGDHPLVCRFMAGIKNLRKPLPKYPVLWDASVLLQFLCQWQVADDDLKGVTLKLVTIIACLSVQRMNTLSKIAVSPVQFQPSGTYLYVFDDLKVARDRPYFLITLPAVGESDPLKTASLLKTYLSLTAKVRSSDSTSLFVSYVKPHKSVSTDTISRWVKEVMHKAGIDTKIFGSHSVRGSAASTAKASDACLDSVLKAGDWSALSSFSKHYCRSPSHLPAPEVANALLRTISK